MCVKMRRLETLVGEGSGDPPVTVQR